jgi:ATP-dependent DNA helicase RecG
MMTQEELKTLLDELRGLPKETEWVEFKVNNPNPHEIGERISGIANSCCLLDRPHGYIVWGVENEAHLVVGTQFKPRVEKHGNEELENWLLHLLNPRIDFSIHEFQFDAKPIVLFTIQSATNVPVKFDGVEYVRIGSYTKKLKDHPEKERQIWAKQAERDWSAQACDGATVNDLDEQAIEVARKRFKEKNPKLAEESEGWTDTAFLDKAKLTTGGRTTNAVIVLLGKAEAEHFLSPSVAEISWVLKDEKGNEKDYEHFKPPFLLQVDKVYGKIRNLKQRILLKGSGTLFPIETTMYEEWVIREALHNCIAHQDYRLQGKITVVEKPNELIFTNLGSFIPVDVEKFIEQDAPPERYRNKLLADAMVNLNMIDTIGSGIKKMFNEQRKRFFPLPDYDVSNPEKVQVRLHGQILDENYSRLLMENLDLDLKTVILLDKVQKKIRLPKDDVDNLRKRGLVEGRYPNVFVSVQVAKATDKKAAYTKSRGLDKEYYKDFVVKFIKQHGQATRKEIDELLWEKLPDILSEKQKKNKVSNLIAELSQKKIQNVGTRRDPLWKLT